MEAKTPLAAQPSSAALAVAWPRCAQLTTAFLVGMVVALVGVQIVGRFSGGDRGPTELHQRIDLNRATLEELLQIPGVGETTAERILEYRRERPFQRVDDLRQVATIGPTRLERLREWLEVTPAAEEARAAPAAKAKPGRSTRSKKEPDHPININEASAEELATLPDIGPSRAAAIIAERGRNPFRTADELLRVKGIGKARLEKLRPLIAVEKSARNVAAAGSGAGTDEGK